MSKKIVVVGSLHYDVVVESDRQPRRGETLMGSRWYPKFGGKGGNQACACALLGADVQMLGAVGSDGFGDFLRNVLEERGVGHKAVITVPGGSGMSVAIVDAEGDYAATVVSGANTKIDPETIRASELIVQADALILQNELHESVNLAAAQAAQSSGVQIIWNAAPMRADT